MTNKKLYSTFDVVKKFGIKLERLRDWIKSDFIRPYKYATAPRGDKAQFTHEQLYEIKLFQHMIENGIARKEASIFLKYTPRVMTEAEEKRYKRSGKKPDVGTIPDFIIISREEGERPDYLGATYSDALELKRYKNRDDIYIINYGKIKKEVDLLP